jgi:DNA topoisomerase VI subunit B
MNSHLERQTFVIPRELEYFSEQELTVQSGYARRDWWPGVAVKELLDNALDACEQAGVAPRITISFDGASLTVADNGPGLPEATLEHVLDFTVRASDKAAYVSPTRGAQGNALKVVLAIPYVLSGGKPAWVEVEAGGVQHGIEISTDQIARRVRISRTRTEIAKSGGTIIRVGLDSASCQGVQPRPGFLQKLVLDYALFNPHATFEVLECGNPKRIEATTPHWRKWLPTDPTSPHWYDVERLETLIGCYVSAERDGGRVRTVREFISEFRGLSGSAKQKQAVQRAGLERGYLHDLTRNGAFDREATARLLEAMRELSSPVRPELLGALGEDHFRRHLQPVGETFRYVRTKQFDSRGLPVVMETAFAATPDGGLRGLRAGLNWSVPLDSPLYDDAFKIDDQHVVRGLYALLAEQRINLERDPVCLAIHLACPRFRFLDRGKGSVALGDGT